MFLTTLLQMGIKLRLHLLARPPVIVQCEAERLVHCFTLLLQSVQRVVVAGSLGRRGGSTVSGCRK